MTRKPVALTIFCLIALAAAAQSAHATFAGKPGLVARGDHSGIYVANPDGSDERLVAESTDARNPAWSPDGRRIAFTARPDGNPFHIYVVNVKNGKIRQITSAPQFDSRPSWAPDGKSIVFVRDMPDDDAVFRLRLKDGRIRQIAEGPHIYAAEFAPNGKSVAVATGLNVYLYATAADGISQLRTLATFPGGDGEQLAGSVGWAPNSKRLVIGTVANGPCDQCSHIWTVKANGEGLKQLTTGGPAGYGVPFYRPRGGKIAFCFGEWNQDNTAFVTELRLMNQNGKHAHRIGSFCGSDWQALPQH
ncbi:MAG: TolB protein [Thermoleophilaceae bacterium]|nr:TolB protein [Thermoleophilaceae bacterium]